MNTPAVVYDFPRERGAITGHVMTDAEIAAMDRRDAYLRRLRAAEYDEYRLGSAPKPTPAPGMNVIKFVIPVCNVIQFASRKPDPTPPTSGAPAAPAPMRRAA